MSDENKKGQETPRTTALICEHQEGKCPDWMTAYKHLGHLAFQLERDLRDRESDLLYIRELADAKEGELAIAAVHGLRNRLSEATARAKSNEDRANAISVMHGKMFDLARECLDSAVAILESSTDLTVEEAEGFTARLRTLDLRLYGPGRPVAPHATGPTINTLETPK